MEKTVLFAFYWYPCKKSFDHVCKSLFLGSQFHSFSIYLCYIFIPLLHCFDYYIIAVIFEIGKCESSNFILFSKIVLSIWAFLNFHMNFSLDFYISAKRKCQGNFDKDCIESIDCLGVVWSFQQGHTIHKHRLTSLTLVLGQC